MGTIDRWFTQSVSVKRLTSQGNSTEKMTTVATVLCLIQEFDGNRRTMAEMGLFKPHRMYCPLNANVQQDDQIVYGSKVFTVKGTIRREQGSVTHLEVLLELGEASGA